jgi:hypothetical protein
MKREAAAFGIDTCFIPVDFTDDLRPSVTCVFGASEAICIRMFQGFVGLVRVTVRKPKAIEFIYRALTEGKENVIRKAWEMYEESSVPRN